MTMAVRGAGWSAPGARAAPTASAPAAASAARPVAMPVIRMSILRMTDRSVNLVTQRGRGARALLPTPRRPPAWLHVRHRLRCQHPRDERRRGAARRRVAVHGVARVLGQGPRAGVGATQEKVRRVARELGYRPNVAAQALRLGSSRAVALVVPDVTNPFFAPRPARRPARGARGGLHGGAGRHGQRPPLGGAIVRGAARRPGRRLPAVRGDAARGPVGRRARRPDREPGPAALVGALRLRGRRRGRLRAPARARPPPHRPSGRGLRRPHLPSARGRPPARAERGRPRPRRAAARGDPDHHRRRPRRGGPAARRAAHGGVLRRRHRRRGALPGRPRARPAHPARPLGHRLRRHGLRARARSGADHRGARCRVARRHRLRAARGAHGRRAPRRPIVLPAELVVRGSTGPPR